MMRHWREREFERHLTPGAARTNLSIWAFFARRPGAYRVLTRIAARALRLWGGKRGRLKSLPLAGGWTAGRDLPVPEGDTFFARYARQQRGARP
jgi:L-lactate dehydrogenase complex protein LldF